MSIPFGKKIGQLRKRDWFASRGKMLWKLPVSSFQFLPPYQISLGNYNMAFNEGPCGPPHTRRKLFPVSQKPLIVRHLTWLPLINQDCVEQNCLFTSTSSTRIKAQRTQEYCCHISGQMHATRSNGHQRQRWGQKPIWTIKHGGRKMAESFPPSLTTWV